MLRTILITLIVCALSTSALACSIVYFIDTTTGKIYVANNEDYYYNVKDYIQIMPVKKNKHARLWYGWDKFSQGGINDQGLFFDGAVAPKQEIPNGYHNPNGRNVGDELLANCKTTQEAIDYLEKEKIAINTGHILIGDAHGQAVILEWVNGEKIIVPIKNNVLIATNFLHSDTSAGGYPCYRYNDIQSRIKKLTESKEPIDLRKFGNVIAGAVQVPRKDKDGKTGGTLYTSVINITDMEFVIVPKLNNAKAQKLDLKKVFQSKRKRKMKL